MIKFACINFKTTWYSQVIITVGATKQNDLNRSISGLLRLRHGCLVIGIRKIFTLQLASSVKQSISYKMATSIKLIEVDNLRSLMFSNRYTKSKDALLFSD